MEVFIQVGLPIILVISMYFFMIVPQQKKQKALREKLQALRKGDEVITIGRLHGIVDEINHDNKTVVLDCEGIYLTFDLQAIAEVKQSEPTQAPVKKATVTE